MSQVSAKDAKKRKEDQSEIDEEEVGEEAAAIEEFKKEEILQNGVGPLIKKQIPETVIQVKALAIMRSHHEDHHIVTKEVILGRDEECSKSNDDREIPLIKVSKSKRVSRRAARIYLNE